MLLAPLPSIPTDRGLSLVAGRSVPTMYVLTSTGEVICADVDAPPLPQRLRAAAAVLLATDDEADVLLALTERGELVRLVRLHGLGGMHFALLVERLETRSPLAAAARRYALSARETEILEQLLRGATTQAIAVSLFIAESTVATHVRNIGAKMDVTKRREIVAKVLDAH